MKAYIFDDAPGDPRLAHDSGREIDEQTLAALGVKYYHLEDIGEVDELANSRGYKNRDEVTISPQAMGSAFEDKIQMFFCEHIHEDEEIRYIRAGNGYFDVRGQEDEWIRIRVEKNDLLILPPGIYHRFTTDDSNYIVAMRLFKDEPKWTPLNRDPQVDLNLHRRGYIAQYLNA